MTKSNDNWTPERVDQLKRLFALGLSRSQIAARMGGWGNSADKGRSAVIGKAYRLGLTRATGKAGDPVVRKIRKQNDLKTTAKAEIPVVGADDCAKMPVAIPERRILKRVTENALGDRMSPFPAPQLGPDGFGLEEIHAIQLFYK